MSAYLIFDFDGTLADSRRLSMQLFNSIADKYRFRKIQEEDIPELQALSAMEKMRWLKVSIWQLPKIAIDLMQRYKDAISLLQPYAGIAEMLRMLQAEGFRMSIISSNQSENIQLFLQQQGWTMFDHVIGSNQLFGKHKSITGFLKKQSMKPSDVLYIGDEIRDIEACRKAGCDVYSVTWGFDSAALLSKGKPNRIIDTTDQLMDAIRTWTKR